MSLSDEELRHLEELIVWFQKKGYNALQGRIGRCDSILTKVRKEMAERNN